MTLAVAPTTLGTGAHALYKLLDTGAP